MNSLCEEIQDRFPQIYKQKDKEGQNHIDTCSSCNEAYSDYCFLKTRAHKEEIVLSPEKRQKNIEAIQKKKFQQSFRMTLYKISTIAAVFVLFFLTFTILPQNKDTEDISDYEWMAVNSSYQLSSEDINEEDIIDYLIAAGDGELQEWLGL